MPVFTRRLLLFYANQREALFSYIGLKGIYIL
jgi:hypothetical protein